MTTEKETALNHVLDRVYAICFNLEADDLIEEYFAENLMIIGTTADEIFFTIDGMRTLIRHQREQSEGFEITFVRKEVFRDYPANENVAIIVDNVSATITMNAEKLHFEIRSSAVLEYTEKGWAVNHWHASKPEQVESEVDTYGIEDWKRKNEQLEQLVKERTAALNLSLENLKATQSQLIHAEKMASLGELTAGIAHEIQNPLNFVNNFSEVSQELIEELQIESQKPKVERDEELEKELLSDIRQNLEKINHHGKRADAIVKGMLQHSQTTSGQKESTDINALADEYLRLAYHGLRAKDKSFNAELITHYDENLPKGNVIPQDIGRVLLNLFTNAFYATQERSKSENENYKPKVEVSTSVNGNNIEIKVIDNGNGIPENIKDKIFQPFFTTKPTGEGTGLGLSLAYDSIKAHGGEIKVNALDKQRTQFTIELPIKSNPI